MAEMGPRWSSSSGRPRARTVGRCGGTVASPVASFIEPDRCQVLIEVVTRADLPALDVGGVGNDPIPPQHPDRMGLGIYREFLELAHQGALLGKVGLAQHLVIEVDFGLVFVIPDR